MAQTILPIKGVPDELITVLNERFRSLELASGAGAQGSRVGLFFAHVSRPDANGTTVGTFGAETDRGVIYQVQTVYSSQVWVYVGGVMSADFADEPADLGSNDSGFLWQVADYAHLLRWNGTGWEFMDEMGGYVAGRVVAPDGNGWQLCDGTATSYLHISAGAVSEVAHTTLNLAGGAYPKFANAYGGAITASNAPGVTKGGTFAAGTGFVTAVDGTGQPPHIDLLPYFRR